MGADFTLTSEQVANIEYALRYMHARYGAVVSAGHAYDSWYRPQDGDDDYDGYSWADAMAVRF
jgi:hypothetical protein